MSKNTAKIKSGFQKLSERRAEILSGIVVLGSTDTSASTISVRFPDGGIIEGVRLNILAGLEDGVILYPEEGSNVVVCNVHGSGERVLLKAGKLSKATITIGSTMFDVTNSYLMVSKGDTVLTLGTETFKVNTATESLYQILKDCFTYLTELTVSTSSGPSGTPINIMDFTTLLIRLDNLLAA